MAKTRDIRTRVAFEGETEYKKVVSDIAAEHKKLNNELKAAQAEFKATGNAEKMFEEKSKLLNKQIEAQNKAIKTAEDALKKLKDNGVDKSSAAWVYWEKELTSAKTAMFNATAELNKLNSEFGNVTSATERATQETADYSETLKSIDKGVKFGNVLNGLRVVKDAVGGVISTAFRMGKALVMSQVSGGDWAREIMMGAAKAGVSVEEYQARLYAQAVGGINTDAITEGVKKTTENLATTDTELLKLYNDLGISTRNADGIVRDATDTFWDSVDALKGIEDQTTRSIYAQKLLGDQYLELRGLVDLGSEGYEKLIEEGKATATVTEESVNALTDMDAAVEGIKLNFSSLKHDVQAELAPGFTEMTDALSGLLTKFNTFIESEAGQEAFDKWNESLTGIADSINEANMEAVFSGMATALGKIIDAFEWLSRNAETIKNIWDSITPDVTPNASRDVLKSAAETILENVEQQTGGAYQQKEQNPILSVTPFEEGYFAKQTQQAKSAKEAMEELMQMVKGLKIAGAFKLRDALEESLANPVYAAAFESEGLTASWESVIDRINSSEIRTAPESLAAVYELLEALKTAMDELTQTAESGGGGAMTAFNAAIEKGTLSTKDTLKSGVAAAFAGLDSVFASMGTAHGAAYINALSAQISRINSMLSMSPSYAYGGTFGSAAQSAYASPTSGMLNASIYVGKQKFGQLTTPIVNAQMGADLQVLR